MRQYSTVCIPPEFTGIQISRGVHARGALCSHGAQGASEKIWEIDTYLDQGNGSDLYQLGPSSCEDVLFNYS